MTVLLSRGMEVVGCSFGSRVVVMRQMTLCDVDEEEEVLGTGHVCWLTWVRSRK